MPEPTTVSKDTLQSFELVEIARYGSNDGPGALDNVNHMAVTDSVLIAQEWRTCEFVVFSRRTQKVLSRFGQCGRGPGDFQNMSQATITVRKDTLYVIDQFSRRVQLFSLTGDLLTSFRLDSTAVPTGTLVYHADWTSDSTLLMAMTLPAHELQNGIVQPQLPDMTILQHVLPSASRVFQSVLREGPAVAKHITRLGRGPRSCVVGLRSQTPMVVAFNIWAKQLVALNVNDLGRPIGSWRLPLREDAAPGTRDARGSVNLPGSDAIACGDSIALFSRRHTPGDGELVVEADLFAYEPKSGTMRYHRATSKDEHALGPLYAGIGNRFFAKHAQRYDFPIIMELELVPSPRR